MDRNVNLDHLIPSASLMSYSEYHKVPKSEEAQLHKKDYLEYRDFVPDESGLSIWDRLRKPEFQRATNGWSDSKIINLLKTLRENQVIPGVIFWLNTETGHIFVLDGAHRLSTIRAWIVDDWGDSEAAKDYGYVEDSDYDSADRLRKEVKSNISDFVSCQEAGKRYRKLVDENKKVSDFLEPEAEAKGRFMYNLNTSLRIPIQWVTGDYKTAEQSFININTGGTPLSEPEVLYLSNRRSPVARAITGIDSNASKPYLWLKYKDECDKLSAELYNAILGPTDRSTSDRVADYPLCLVKKQRNFERYLFLQTLITVAMRGETGEDNLRTVMQDYANEQDDEIVAKKTLETLKTLGKAIGNIHSKKSSSLGLYPAFYYYTNKGHFKELLFLMFLSLFSTGSASEIVDRKIRFTLTRDLFEETWMIGKEYFFQALGRKGAGPSRMTFRHVETLQKLIDITLTIKDKSGSPFDVLGSFLKELDAKIHGDFTKQYAREIGTPYAKFSDTTKVYGESLTLFNSGTPRCEICGGRVLFEMSQADHGRKRSEGGTNSVNNLSFIHPFCNNHKDRLKDLKRCFGDGKTFIQKPTTVQLPSPKPDSDIEQLRLEL